MFCKLSDTKSLIVCWGLLAVLDSKVGYNSLDCFVGSVSEMNLQGHGVGGSFFTPYRCLMFILAGGSIAHLKSV